MAATLVLRHWLIRSKGSFTSDALRCVALRCVTHATQRWLHLYKQSTRKKQKARRQSSSDCDASTLGPEQQCPGVTATGCDAGEDRLRRRRRESSVNEALFTRAHNGQQARLTSQHCRKPQDTSTRPLSKSIVTLEPQDIIKLIKK